jgi:hypothetical protein
MTDRETQGPASIEKKEIAAENVLQPPYDLALQLGLRSYGKFESKMSPLFARVSSDERERFLHQIYRLAAQKVLMETSRADAKNQAQLLTQEAEAGRRKSGQIEVAIENLLAASNAQSQESPERSEVAGIILQLRDLKRRQEERQQSQTKGASELQNLEGKDVTVSSGAPSSLQYAVRLRRLDESDEQLLDSYIQSITTPPQQCHCDTACRRAES